MLVDPEVLEQFAIRKFSLLIANATTEKPKIFQGSAIAWTVIDDWDLQQSVGNVWIYPCYRSLCDSLLMNGAEPEKR